MNDIVFKSVKFIIGHNSLIAEYNNITLLEAIAQMKLAGHDPINNFKMII